MKVLDALKAKLKARARQLGAAGVATLAIGSVAGAFGVDLAPAQVDALVTAGAVLLYALRELRENKQQQQ